MTWVASVLFLFLFLVGASADAQIRILGDVTVRPAPESAPDAERLAYAERLYDADRAHQATQIARELSRGHGVEAAEALLLLARIEYSEGHPRRALTNFRNLLLRFPDAPPVRDGRVLSLLEQATVWLLEDYEWQVAKGYLAAIEDLSPAVVARLARDLEVQFDQELEALHARLLAETQDLAQSFERWFEHQRHERCEVVRSCMRRDEACMDSIPDKVREAERMMPDRHRQEWLGELDAWYAEQREEFASRLYGHVRDLPMLTRLLSEERMLASVVPPKRAETVVPFRYRIQYIDFTRNETWSWSGQPGLRARLCRQPDEVRVEVVRESLEPLRVDSLDRGELLAIFGRELRDPPESAPGGRPRL